VKIKTTLETSELDPNMSSYHQSWLDKVQSGVTHFLKAKMDRIGPLEGGGELHSKRVKSKTTLETSEDETTLETSEDENYTQNE
jgi:hypothetical protein